MDYIPSHAHNGVDSPLIDLDANGIASLPDPNTVVHGGTGATTLTNHGVLLGQGTAAIVATSVGATNTVLHGNTGADPSYSAVVEADITLADNTTNNSSTSKHGFLKKLDNNSAHFMDGTGAWSTPSASVPVNFYGNGSDGDATISSPTSLTADKHYNNLTVNSPLDNGGHRIFVKGTLNGSSYIHANGNAGSAGNGGISASGASAGNGQGGGAGGAARTTGTLWGGNAGIAGQTGGNGNSNGVGSNATAGDNGVAKTGTINGNGKGGAAGGAGGNAGGGIGGTGGTGGGVGIGTNNLVTLDDPWMASTMTASLGDVAYQIKNTAGSGGAGGGGGGGSASAFQGGGGGGGGSGGGGGDAGDVCIFAYAVDATGGLTFKAIGGNGAVGGTGGACTGSPNNGGTGGGGGGGASGAGGLIVIVYTSLTGSISADVSAGTAGNGGAAGTTTGTGGLGAAGTNGTAGTAGTLYQIQIS